MLCRAVLCPLLTCCCAVCMLCCVAGLLLLCCCCAVAVLGCAAAVLLLCCCCAAQQAQRTVMLCNGLLHACLQPNSMESTMRAMMVLYTASHNVMLPERKSSCQMVSTAGSPDWFEQAPLGRWPLLLPSPHHTFGSRPATCTNPSAVQCLVEAVKAHITASQHNQAY